MKLLVSLVFIVIVSVAIYFFLVSKGKKKRAGLIAVIVAVWLLGLLAFYMYRSASAPDLYCFSKHTTFSTPPRALISAMDYFEQGNYDYDTGNCRDAIVAYTISIGLDPTYPQAYNNRAYTGMRMQNYKVALEDLDKAIDLNPNYAKALMNRADIHNFYYAIDRKSAAADYKRVMFLGGVKGNNVCGHLFLAEHNGWNLGTVLDFPWGAFRLCK